MASRDGYSWLHVSDLKKLTTNDICSKYYANRLVATPEVGTQKKMQANLQFAIDRVVHFIEKYCAFVSQGGEYYRKFSRIMGSYQHEKTCSGALPETFGQLKSDIEVTLEKFNNAYHLPEIQGSWRFSVCKKLACDFSTIFVVH
jgi:hypothetical protein